jgi:hypothetical protein
MSQMSFFDVPPVTTLPDDPRKPPEGGTGVTPVTRPVRPHLIKSPSGDHEARPALPDYRILEDAIGSGGAMAKVRANLEIIQLLHHLQVEGRQATTEEQQKLVLYSGWGHTAQPFHPQPKGKWATLQTEMRPYFTDIEWRSASFSTINAHYTSPEVIRWKWQVIERLGFKGGQI